VIQLGLALFCEDGYLSRREASDWQRVSKREAGGGQAYINGRSEGANVWMEYEESSGSDARDRRPKPPSKGVVTRESGREGLFDWTSLQLALWRSIQMWQRILSGTNVRCLGDNANARHYMPKSNARRDRPKPYWAALRLAMSVSQPACLLGLLVS
jgi:hypothetical protein